MRRSVVHSLTALIVVSLLGWSGGTGSSAPIVPAFDVTTSALTFGPQVVNSGSSSQIAMVTTSNSRTVISLPGIVMADLPESFEHAVQITAFATSGPSAVMFTTGGQQSIATSVVPSQNNGPVAHAEVRGFVKVGKTVYLDGTGSTTVGITDASSGQALTFHWTLVSAPEGSAASLANADSAQPSLAPDLPGTYVVELTVSDGTSSTSTRSILSTINSAPIANAGPDQFATIGSIVHLDGSASTDMDGDSLTYQWNLLSAPAGSGAALSNPQAISPTFTVDVDGDYLFQLSVNDDHGSTSSDTVLVSTVGISPVPNAGPAKKVALNQSVELDGSASSHPAERPITCTWELLFRPSSSSAQLSNAGPSDCTVKPSFTADQSGLYLAQLIVSDPDGHQAVATTSASTEQMPPVANAGSAQIVDLGDAVQLDGSESFDPDGDTLTYVWSLIAKPVESTATLSQTTSVRPVFVADRNGDYVAQLIVTDGVFASAPSTVLISVESPALDVTDADLSSVNAGGIIPNRPARPSRPSGIQIIPSVITFSAQSVGSTSSGETVSIGNPQGIALSISNLQLIGTNASDFTFTPNTTSFTVPAQGSASISITFAPSATGSRAAALRITDDSGQHDVSLSGTGIASGLSLDPASIVLGKQLISTSSQPVPVKITNIGTASLLINSLTVSGTNSSDFSVAAATPITIQPQQSAMVTVTFTPSTATDESATLLILDNTMAGTHSASLSGTGIAPAISVTPTMLAFGDQPKGAPSTPATLTINNAGTADLVVSTLSITGANAADFVLSPPPTLPLTIKAGQNATLSLVFTPGSAGSRAASLAIAHNATSSPLNVALSGNGTVPGITPNPSAVDFGNQLVNSPSPTQTLTVTNSGTAPLILNGIAITGANSADFNFASGFTPPTPATPLTVTPGNSTPVPLTFKPSATGARVGSLAITGNANANVTLSGNGTAPTISVSPASLPFGDQPKGIPSNPATLTINNTGTADLLISTLTITGANVTDFALSTPPTLPLTIKAGQNATLSFVFTPADTGNRTASLTIAHNATGSPLSVGFTGNGTVPGITPNPSTVNFGNQLVNSTSATQTLTLTNSGTAPLIINGITITGTNSADFNFASGFTPPTPAIPITVVPENSTAVPLTFKPAAEGARAGTLAITGNASANVTLSGNGIAPAISVSPTTLAFGDQPKGTPSTPATLTINNTGTADLVVSTLTITGANATDFVLSASPTLPLTIKAGQNATVSFVFTPGSAGSRTASLAIAHNATGSPLSVALTGNGTVPGISPSPSAVDFGNQLVNSPSPTQILILTNSGMAPLILNGIAITGANSADFAFANGFTPPTQANSTTVAPGNSTTVPLTFKPSATGVRAGTLVITGNTNANVTLFGNGTAPAISVSPASLPFGDQSKGIPSNPATLTINNTGTADLLISTLTITGANAADFVLSAPPTLPLTIKAGQNATLSCVFTPADTGSRTASLTIAHNATGSPLNVALSGNGTVPGITPNPSAVNFGNQLINSTSATQTLTLTNSGMATLVINGISVVGTNSADFNFAGGFTPPTPVNPTTVAPGNSTTVPLTFKPSAEGARAGMLAITGNTSTNVTLSGNGTAPHVGLSATSIPFGSQQVEGTTTPVTIRLTNTGTAPLTVSNVNLGGNNPGDFVLGVITTPFVVAPSTTANFTAAFKPTALDGRSAQISITSNAVESPSVISLTGTGTGVPPQISPTSINFNDQSVGTTSSGSTVSINNLHSTPLSVSNVQLLGTNPGDFAFLPATTSFTVPAQGSASITVKFTPSVTGVRSATLRIINNTGTTDVTLSGNGTASGVTLTPASVAFGQQLISTASQPIPVKITNTGTASLLINSLSVSGSNSSDFSLSAAATPFAIQPQQSATVTVTFTPRTASDESATLVIGDNTTSGSHSVSLTGTGTAPSLSVAPTTLPFGGQPKGTSSNPLTVTITNSGTGDLLISNLMITGPNASDFTFSTAPSYPITIAAGANGSVALVFAPTTSAAESATLTITSNAPQTTVPLSGTGTVAQIGLNPPNTVAFGSQLLNTPSATATVTISNPGTADLRITNLAFSGTNATDFTLAQSPTYPVVVAANGGSTSVGVIFTPKTLGAETATLTFTDNAAGSPQVLWLTGSGVAPAIGPLSPVNFGNVNVGSTSSAMSLTVTNPGSAPLHITSLSFGGVNAGDFSTTSVTPIVVDPNNGTAIISLQFAPTDVGPRIGTLLINDDATGSPHSATLNGMGVGVPKFGVTPTSLDFGSIEDGSTTPPQALTITNSGTADLVINRLIKTGANGGDFLYSVVGTQNNDFPTTVTPGSSLTVNVSFKPSDPGGTRTATLIFQDAASTTLGSVGVGGVGIQLVPQISLNKTTLAFPPTPTTISSTPLSVVVTNNGTKDLTISALTITGGNPSDFSVTQVAPITVAKAGGTATLSVTFKPTVLGLRSATLAITNDAGNLVHDDTVALSGTGRDLGRLNLQPATVGKDLELLAIGSVDVAPTKALSITISSSDPSKLLLAPLSTDPTGVNAGVVSFVGTLAAGKGINGNGFPAFWIQSLASSGTAQITMTAPGYTSTSATITLTPSGFVLISPLGQGSNFTTQLNAADTNLTIGTAQLDTNGNVVQTDKQLRGGLNVSVDVSSATPATGTISGTPVSIQGGNSSSTAGAVKFHPVAIGTTLLSIAQPAGFMTPVSGGQLTATVHAPSLSLTSTIVGYNLQVLGSGSLNTAAPSGGLQVTITSNDVGKVLLTTDPNIKGSGSITVLAPPGSTVLPTYYIQGLAPSGSATMTASAAGYSDGVATVLLNPSGFVVNSPNALGQFTAGDFVTTSLSAATPLQVSVWQLNSSLVPITAGQFRGGADVSVPVQVSSSTPASGVIDSGAVTFHGGDYAQTGMSFQPNASCVSPCTSVISISHPVDYATPSPGGQIIATVSTPAITLRLSGQTTVGNNLQILAGGALDVPAPSDLPVTITSNNPNVLLSASPTETGSQTVNLTVPFGYGVNAIGFPNYYVQALSDSGTAQLTVSAPGFQSSDVTVTLAPSGFVIQRGNDPVGTDFGILLINGNVPLTVSATVLDPVTGNPTVLYQAVRGGSFTSVDVTSSAPDVATIGGTPLFLTSGNATGTITLQPQSTGQTNISITTPPGYATPAKGNQFTVTVN